MMTIETKNKSQLDQLSELSEKESDASPSMQLDDTIDNPNRPYFYETQPLSEEEEEEIEMNRPYDTIVMNRPYDPYATRELQL